MDRDNPASAQCRGIDGALDELARALRAPPLPVIGRTVNERLLLDLRGLEDAAAFVAQPPALQEAPA